MTLRYPRTARLLRPADFTLLRRQGKRFSSRCFQAEYRSTDCDTARLGMAVSRRVSKLAVVRNRIRRIMRDSFRLNRPTLPACDILLIARSAAVEHAGPALRAELSILWAKLATLKETGATVTMPPGS